MSQKPLDESRRKVLRGVAAAPAIFTLPASAALPMGSFGSTCAVDATRRNVAPVNLTTNPDQWVRVQLPIYEVKIGSSSGAPAQGWTEAVKVAELWYDRSTGGRIGLVQASRLATPSKFAYGLVDYSGGTGGTYSFYPQSSVYTPVPGASCWNSLNPSNQITADNVLR